MLLDLHVFENANLIIFFLFVVCWCVVLENKMSPQIWKYPKSLSVWVLFENVKMQKVLFDGFRGRVVV